MQFPEQTRRALGHVYLSASNASWANDFALERERLQPVLGDAAVQLQHYGSTAVPGLSAKPIIDMMTPVASLEEADRLAGRLHSAGYDNVDAGFFKRRFFRKAAANGNPGYHLHLVVAPGWPLKNELLLRDWLIQHPAVAQAYEALKQELAAEYADDMPRYTAGKTAFLRAVVNEARLSRGLPIETDWGE